MNRIAALALLATALAACRGTPAGPAEQKLQLAVHGDSVIFTTASSRTEDLRVAVLDASTGATVSGVPVEWRVVSGSASLGRSRSNSDDGGVASTWLNAAPEGVYRVEATTDLLTGRAPVLEVRVVPRPTLTGVQPSTITAGGEVTVTGANFSAVAGETAIYFDGVRGQVLSATRTSLRVRVPECLPARTAQLTAGLGAVLSEPSAVQVSGTGGSAVALAPGGVRTFRTGEELRCIRLPGDAGASWILVIHNVAERSSPPFDFELRALQPQPVTATEVIASGTPRMSFADGWEAALRVRERQLGPARPDPAALEGLTATAAALPTPGSRRDFSVLASDQKFRKITATAQVVGSHAIIYVDDEAEGAFSADDLQFFARTFDDPIYPTMVGVFGEPSDLDGNERIIILFTPQVNLLTPRGAGSFISGFFYGCDLVARSRCSGTNQGEVFYALVPDVTGRWGDVRGRATVRAAVPPVLAHEFQHMIHFARRGFSNDALWLSEGLAHTAEELIADVLQARGQAAFAQSFRTGNHGRAQQFLASTATTQLLGDELPGSLELRGGAWLFMRYVRAHHGGSDLLRRLTGSTRSSVANVVQETGRNWQDLAADFGVALWAADAPDMRGALEPRYTFGEFRPRTVLGGAAGYPLRPPALPWRDLSSAGVLAAAGNAYFSVSAPSGGSEPLTFVVTGERGVPLGSTGAVSLIRVR
jgi:hypothetical protein